MYKNKFNRKWTPCDICKWGNDYISEEEIKEHCNNCNELASEWEESNEFKQFKLGIEMFKAFKKIQKQQEEINKLKQYPIIIMTSDDIKEKLLNINNDAIKKGIIFININSYQELEYYKDKKYFELYVLLCPNNIGFRDSIYMDNWIMENIKVFNVYHEIGSPYLLKSDPIQDFNKKQKDILNLKLDKRFDQIPISPTVYNPYLPLFDSKILWP